MPFAFAIAALVTGRVGEGWLLETRRWALFSWAFLTIGILLGGWWSYEVLGWSGVWAWDPVENASFLPWLTGTAYLHSVLVQERRGMLRVWNLSLLVATFALTILGTFLTRSGVLSSVHAFGDGPVGAYLLGFFGARRRRVAGPDRWRGDRLRSPGAIDSPLSREGAFLANNVLFTVFAFVVLLGTVFPLLVEALQDRRIVVGAPYFDRLSTPIGLALLFLMAVAPVLPWRKASMELLRDRLFWPAWCGAAALVVAVLVGATGWASLRGVRARPARRRLGVAPGRAGHSAPGLARARRSGQRRDDRPPRRDHDRRRPRRLELATPARRRSTSRRRTRRVGRPLVRAAGGARVRSTTGSQAVVADVALDGGDVYQPAITKYVRQGIDVPTPSVQTGVTNDVYLTLERGAVVGGDTATIRVIDQAADPVAVDRRRRDGRRHAAGRLPRPPPAPTDRPGVGADRRRRRPEPRSCERV